MGKLQPNVKLTFLNLLAEHWTHWTPIIECDDSFAVSFADLQREFYKFHSLLVSVGEFSGDKL